MESAEEYVKYLFNLSVMTLVFALIALFSISPIFRYFEYRWVFALVSGAIAVFLIVYIGRSLYKHLKMNRPKI